MPNDLLTLEPERLESSGRERSHDESSQTDDRADGPDASATQSGHLETQSGRTPRIGQIRQHVRHDEETSEEIRKVIADPEEIHEVIAKA